VAQDNGLWVMLGVSAGFDFLTKILPLILQSYKIWLAKQDKKDKK
jgi:hypothetical protein